MVTVNMVAAGQWSTKPGILGDRRSAIRIHKFHLGRHREVAPQIEGPRVDLKEGGRANVFDFDECFQNKARRVASRRKGGENRC